MILSVLNGNIKRVIGNGLLVTLKCVPTQLLQFDDGLTTQGFARLDDFQILNPDLIVAGSIIGQSATGMDAYSVLAVDTGD